jgi:3-methyladenine DNA glycosylase AlkC
MADALKDMFNKKFYVRLAEELHKADKNFHSEKFVKDVIIGLDELSLNQRLRNTTVMMKKYLPADYKKSVEIILNVVPEFKSHYTCFIFPDFVGQYGHDHVNFSLNALKALTQYGTSEFAIREFLKRDLNGTLKVMNKWAEDENVHVRRLASEGSRPRLPWSFNLPEIMNNPGLTLPILEKLKDDNELYVKKSVANHLNDFSRTHTDWMLKVLNSWDKKNENTAWIVKHASRTLIKKGHPGSLAVFEFEKNVKVELSNLKLKKLKIKLGENLEFDFEISSLKNKSQKLVIDYAIHYMKKGGEQNRKVFKLKELDLKPGEKILIKKSQSFKDFSTRKHYAGKHALEIMINGKSQAKKEFMLNTD